jgi:hypothetical protein
METPHPQFSLADILRWQRYRRKRDTRGSKWCVAHGFGADRRDLDQALPFNVIAVAEHSEMDRAIARTEENSREYLKQVCRLCPLMCELRGK